MAEIDLSKEINELKDTFSSIRAVVDPAKIAGEIAELKEQAADPNLWDDTSKAQAVTSKLSRAQAQLTKLEGIENRLDDLVVLVELANDADDSASQNEAKAELESLSKDTG